MLSAAAEVQDQLCVVAPGDGWCFVKWGQVGVKFKVSAHPVGGIDVTVGVVDDGLHRSHRAHQAAHVGVAQLDELRDCRFQTLSCR